MTATGVIFGLVTSYPVLGLSALDSGLPLRCIVHAGSCGG
jgi:hypothetical protein